MEFIAYYESPLGLLKIICHQECIIAIHFTEQQDEPPNPNAITKLCQLQLEEYFSGKRREFDLPLNQSGTAFQQKVWELLLQIPYGKTISYLALSKQYGDPKAIRAIASANGKNNLPIIVPCHRVIGSNQSLTGYSGGLWRKQWLLTHEATHHSGVQQFVF